MLLLLFLSGICCHAAFENWNCAHACSGLVEIPEDCAEPFDGTQWSHCLSRLHPLDVMSSGKCAASWAKTYKIEGDKETFKNIATVAKQLNDECGKLLNKVCVTNYVT